MNTATIKKPKIENFKNVRSQELVNDDMASMIKVNPELAVEKLKFQKGEISLLEQQVESLAILKQNLTKTNNQALLDISNKAGDIKALQEKVRLGHDRYISELSNNNSLKKSINNRDLVIFFTMLGLLLFMGLSVYYRSLSCL